MTVTLCLSHVVLFFSEITISLNMAPNKKSIVWQYYEKNDEKTARCKLCQKNVKTTGNTSNAMAHIKNIHKAIYLEVFQNKNTASAAVTKDSDLSNPIPNSSKQDNITMSKSTVNKHQLLPSTSTSPPIDTSEISTNNSQTDQKIDYTRELHFNRQRSIESSFGEMYAYTSSGDKT